MLTAEYSAHWLPFKTLSTDAETTRRLELLHNGSFWAAPTFADPAKVLQNFEAWFLPWEWPEIQTWQCYKITGTAVARVQTVVGGVASTPGDVIVEPQEVTAYAKSRDELKAHYLREITYEVKESTEQAGSLSPRKVCLPLDQAKLDSEIDDTSPEPKHTGWLRSYLAQKAQALPPHNIALKMAWVSAPMEVATFQPATTRYVWFPVFTQVLHWQPALAGLPTIDASGFCVASYPATATGTPLKIIMKPAPPPPPVAVAEPQVIMRYHAEQEFDPLRLNGAALTVSDTQEWLSGLSHRAAIALDLPQWLVEWLQKLITPPETAPLLAMAESGIQDQKTKIRDFLNQCRAYIIGASRDLAGLGRLPGPDKRYLTEAVWLQATKDKWWYVAAQGFVEEANVTPVQKESSLTAFVAAVKTWEGANVQTFSSFLTIWNGAPTTALPKSGVLRRLTESLGITNPLDAWPELAISLSAEAVKEFVAQANAYLSFVRKPEHAGALITTQWKDLMKSNTPPWKNAKSTWVTEALKGITDPVRDQAEGLLGLSNYWERLFSTQVESDEDGRQKAIATQLQDLLVTDDGLWKKRFGTQTDLFPQVPANPFDLTIPTELSFLKKEEFHSHIRGVFGIATGFPPPAPSTLLAPPTLLDMLFPNRTQVYPAPPPVRVSVDQPCSGNEVIPTVTSEEDFNNELSGVVLFCRPLGQDEWRPLNLAETFIVNNGAISPEPLDLPQLIPSAVGEQDGARVSYRRFDNENPSIAVSPDDHDEAPATAEEEALLQAGAGKHQLRFSLPSNHKAPSLHYGKEYQIAGGLVTNAGVLPPCLREEDGTEYLAIPKLKEWTGLGSRLGVANHLHKRQVPVGPVRFGHLNSADAKKPLFPIPVTPSDVATPAANGQTQASNKRAIRPIACDLPEWSSHSSLQSGSSEPKTANQTLALLFPGKKPAAIKEGLFEEAIFNLFKPSTGFWNWFAWLDDWNACDQQRRIQEWSNEILQRKNGNDRQTGYGPLDDPAVEGELYCEVQELFPAKQKDAAIYKIKYRAVPANAGARSGPIEVKVRVGAYKSPVVIAHEVGKLTVTVPQGRVIRLTLSSLVDASRFTDDKFHSFMATLPGAKRVEDSSRKQCIAVSPVELWIESARQWEPKLRETLAHSIWKAVEICPPDAYTLKWHEDLPSIVEIPLEGWREIHIAKIQAALHFVVFDADRHRVLALDQSKLPLSGSEKADHLPKLVEQLKQWKTSPTPELEREIISHVGVVTGWIPDRKLQVRMNRVTDFEHLAQLGRLDVWHQIWRWDGREVNADLVKQMLSEENGQRDVVNPEVEMSGKSIEWDGAAFATRPDYSHRSSPSSLGVWRDKANDAYQEVFTSELSDDLRCTYYRFAVQGFSRYEAVFGSSGVLGQAVLQDKPTKVEQPWRRVLVKASRKERLPKPAVRFALPLTGDIADRRTPVQAAAAIMLVLDDVWFAEAGLADQFEVAVRILTHPGDGTKHINAGFDPTLTAIPVTEWTTLVAPAGEAAGALNGKEATSESPGETCDLSSYLLGPYGLTHDYAAKTPKLRGSSFILRVPIGFLSKLNGTSGDTASVGQRLPWFLCEIITRRVLRERSTALPRGITPEELASEWSARTWVQFVPNTNLLLPDVWRGPCADVVPKKIEVHKVGDEVVCALPDLRSFDDTFEQRHERWLVLAKRITDLKGRPAERYLATFVESLVEGKKQFVLRDGDRSFADESPGKPLNGYLRLVLVRRRSDASPLQQNKVWQSLFATENEGGVTVMDDAIRGLPIVTGRVAVTF